MKKSYSRVFIILGLFAIALVVGNGILFGYYDGDGDMGGEASPVLITDICEVTMSISGTTITIVEGGTYVIDTWTGGTLDILVRLDLIYPSSWPDEMHVDLVLHTGQIISSHDLSTLGYNDYYEVRSGSFDTSAVPTGVFGASFVFRGGWDGDTANIISPLGGESAKFYIQRNGESRPDAPTVNVLTPAQTIAPFTYYDILWEWTYSGPVRLRVIDYMNGAPPEGLQDIDAQGSTIKQTYSYSYYARYSGEHYISLQVIPEDGSDNTMVEDRVRIYVSVGGEEQEFSPTIERVDIEISAKIYETGVVQEFSWNLWSDAPDWKLSQTAVDGVFNIAVVVVPADALTDCVLYVDKGTDSESFHPLTQSGGTWTVSINTDVFSEGLHHLTIDGVDRTNQQTYTLGEFDISVRQTQISPIIYIGILVVGVFVVIFVVLRRKK